MMFSNLARRSQILVDRLIGHLDHLERSEADPDRRARLFQLDHLATRMRRNDENLLVLANADARATRGDWTAASIGDVLRAAQSEVEQYTRIEFGVVDEGVEVSGHAVDDVVHLLAELFDNATAYSPPETAVVVDARRVGDRLIVEVEDRGTGISEPQLVELNRRLANPPEAGVAVSRMMGLVVVSRIAGRHGIQVELRNAGVGIIADVVLPAGALVMGPRPGYRALPVAPRPAGLAAPRSAGQQPTPRSAGQAVPRPAGPATPGPRSGPSPRPAGPATLPPAWFAGDPPQAPGGAPVVPHQGGTAPAEQPRWSSGADAGWRAASAASRPAPDGNTRAGLPKRDPMTHLVPGTAEGGSATARPVPVRSADSVRGFLSAYHSGVERGRGRGGAPRPRR